MPALIPAGPKAVAVAPELVESARSYARSAKAPRTLEAYRRDWRAFVTWCESVGLPSLPAEPATVALYIAARADAGARPASLDRYLAAIAAAHKSAGFPSPRGSACVDDVLAGIRREKGSAQRQAAPILPGHLQKMIQALPAGVLGQRDRALLLLGFAGAFRRSELCALEVADLAFVDDGLEVTLRRSKTDQEGRGARKAIVASLDPQLCPVRAVRDWLEAAGIQRGPVFRAVNRHGRVAERLTPQSVSLVVKRSAHAAGLDAGGFSGHSLRAGFATAAAKAGRALPAIQRMTGHRSIEMVARYIREAELWSDNAGRGLL